MSVENVLNCVVMMMSKQKHLTVAKKIRLLEFYDKENLSAPALADKFGIGRTQITDLIKK